jgi:hypothetical protein
MADEIGTLQSTSPICGQSPQLSPKFSYIPSYVSFSHIEDKDGHLSSHQVDIIKKLNLQYVHKLPNK